MHARDGTDLAAVGHRSNSDADRNGRPRDP